MAGDQIAHSMMVDGDIGCVCSLCIIMIWFSHSTVMNIHDRGAGLQVSVGRDWFLCQIRAKHCGHKYVSSRWWKLYQIMDSAATGCNNTPCFLRINITLNVPIYYIFSLLQLIASTLSKPICYNSDFESSLRRAKDTFCTWESDEVRMSRLPCMSYPRFDDGGPGVQNTLHLSQGRDDKKITGDNSRHGIS